MRNSMKIKNLYILALLLACFICVASCEEKKALGGSTKVDTSVAKADTVAVVMEKGGMSENLTMHIAMSYFTGENAEKLNRALLNSGLLLINRGAGVADGMTPEKAVKEFMRQYVEDYKEFYSHVNPVDCEAFFNRPAEYSLDTEVKGGREGVANYIARYKDSRGDVQSEYTVCKNFSVKEAKVLTLDDVFLPGFEAPVAELIGKALMKKYDVDDMNALKAKGIAAFTDLYPSSNFILSESSVTFIFVPGEIADNTVGEIQVEVDNSDLENCLR